MLWRFRFHARFSCENPQLSLEIPYLLQFLFLLYFGSLMFFKFIFYSVEQCNKYDFKNILFSKRFLDFVGMVVQGI